MYVRVLGEADSAMFHDLPVPALRDHPEAGKVGKRADNQMVGREGMRITFDHSSFREVIHQAVPAKRPLLYPLRDWQHKAGFMLFDRFNLWPRCFPPSLYRFFDCLFDSHKFVLASWLETEGERDLAALREPTMPIACTHSGASGRCRHPWHDQNAIARAVITAIAEHCPGCHKDHPGSLSALRGERNNIGLAVDLGPLP